jgi:hypothetical protein
MINMAVESVVITSIEESILITNSKVVVINRRNRHRNQSVYAMGSQQCQHPSLPVGASPGGQVGFSGWQTLHGSGGGRIVTVGTMGTQQLQHGGAPLAISPGGQSGFSGRQRAQVSVSRLWTVRVTTGGSMATQQPQHPSMPEGASPGPQTGFSARHSSMQTFCGLGMALALIARARMATKMEFILNWRGMVKLMRD